MSRIHRRIGLTVVCLLATVTCSWAAAPQSQPDASGKMAATVNGEPILESEVLANLPEDSFDDNLQDARQTKLDRLIETAVLAQFIKARKIDVPEAKVKEAIAEFESNLNTASCSCCGGFANLQAYLNARWFTMAEFERRVRADVGMSLYVAQLLTERVTPAMVKERRPAIEKDYIKGEILFFSFRYDPDFFSKPDAVKARCEQLAKQVSQRLQKGDAFDKVVEGLGTKAIHYPGDKCMPATMLSDEARAAWPKLTAGKYCDPFSTSVGWYIIRPQPLTDDDVRDVIRKQLEETVTEQVRGELKAALDKAKIDRPGKADSKR